MTKELMTRTLVETIVTRGIKNISEDPRRSIRKLVDLGDEAAKTPFQRNFFDLIQRMLKNGDSPYYDMVERAVRETDHQKLKTVGINFGWNCLTVGAEKIQTIETERGHNIPWSITLHIGGNAGDMSTQEYKTLISQGKELGIFAYLLCPDESEAGMETALELIAGNDDCVFFLWLPSDCGVTADMSRLSPYNNLIVGVDTLDPDWETTVNCLRDAKCLWVLYRSYETAEDVEEITSEQWIEHILPYAGIAVFCIAGPECPPEESRQVYRYIQEARLGQWYPTLPVDYYRDMMSIDQCISQDECYVGVLPDGTVTEFLCGREAPTAASVRSSSLDDALKRFTK